LSGSDIEAIKVLLLVCFWCVECEKKKEKINEIQIRNSSCSCSNPLPSPTYIDDSFFLSLQVAVLFRNKKKFVEEKKTLRTSQIKLSVFLAATSSWKLSGNPRH